MQGTCSALGVTNTGPNAWARGRETNLYKHYWYECRPRKNCWRAGRSPYILNHDYDSKNDTNKSLSLSLYIYICMYTKHICVYIYIYISLSLSVCIYIYIYIYIHVHGHSPGRTVGGRAARPHVPPEPAGRGARLREPVFGASRGDTSIYIYI